MSIGSVKAVLEGDPEADGFLARESCLGTESEVPLSQHDAGNRPQRHEKAG